MDHLQDQARAALSQAEDDLAREALSRKAAAQAQLDAIEPQHDQLTEQEEKLEHTLDALQKRVNEFPDWSSSSTAPARACIVAILSWARWNSAPESPKV